MCDINYSLQVIDPCHSSMGSLPKLDILQKKTPEKFLKNLLLEAKLVKAEMGNLCSMGASAASKKVQNGYYVMSLTAVKLQQTAVAELQCCIQHMHFIKHNCAMLIY